MNVDKGGFSQTLYNIFSFVKPENFLFITSEQARKIAPTSWPFASRTLTYNVEIIPVQKNRMGKYVNKFISWFNYSFSEIFSRFTKIRLAIKNFNPEVVIAAPSGAEGVFAYHKLKAAFHDSKIVPYFMDDWLHQSHLQWLGGNIQCLTKQMLNENDAWMMISESLAAIFSERYLVKPERILEIHNPVDLNGVVLSLPVQNKEEFVITYAGALWSMHFDAFLVMAKAIKLLQKKRKIKLVLYTAEGNWEWRKDEFKDLNVIYGGFIAYKDINKKLAEADCLLVASSFTGEWQTHTRGSVQTKITDYMKAARLIIGCGPAYAANHRFLKKYNCGICIETNEVREAAKQLDNILDNIKRTNQYVLNGFEALRNNFSFEKVHRRLHDFLDV